MWLTHSTALTRNVPGVVLCCARFTEACMDEQTDYHGHDVKKPYYTESACECQKICEEVSECEFYTFSAPYSKQDECQRLHPATLTPSV